jgi:hypothetical protein
MHNFFLAMVLACCNQLLRQRPIGSGVHGCGKMLLGVSMDGAHNSTHSSCKGNGPGAGLLANLLVVSAISVWKPDPDTNDATESTSASGRSESYFVVLPSTLEYHLGSITTERAYL